MNQATAADEPATPRSTSPAHKLVVFKLQHSAADSVVTLLDGVLPSLVRSDDLRLVADARTNSILVTGTDDVLTKVKAVIQELDVEEPERRPNRRAEVKVFTLEQVSAREAAETLRSLYADRAASPFGRQRGGGDSRVAIAADERANSVIVTGDEEILNTIEALLLRLDQPRPREEAPQTEVIGLQSVPADDVAETLLRLGVSRVEVVADKITNTIILRGDRKSVEQATDLLSKLYERRRPQADDVRLRVIWLVSPGLAGEDAADPPQNLDKVLDALKSKAGVGDLKMAAQFLLNASGVGGRQLSATGTTTLRSGRGRADISLDAAIDASSDGSPRLEIAIDVKRAEEAGSPTICRLNTVLSAPAGHPVVLGMTPIDSMASVFVIEILPPDEPDAADTVEPMPAGGTRPGR
ncbi:MAG TPA: secretin N-terminal domain-containing protein [Planctomycetaceae bacterium]|nr:secretin N-terminal domain-containing protein [Planctomycetaceae bacterium]